MCVFSGLHMLLHMLSNINTLLCTIELTQSETFATGCQNILTIFVFITFQANHVGVWKALPQTVPSGV